MPLYDFMCNKCNHTQELFLGMNEQRPTICPKCNQETLVRVFNTFSIGIDIKQPKTIGELADKNTEKMVKEGKLPKSALEYDSNRKKKKKMRDRVNKIASMNRRQKERYIATGEM